MKIYIYKCLIAAAIFFVLFQITIGTAVREVEKQLYSITSKENLENAKSKVREELKNAIQKDRYLSEEDAVLISDFMKKIKSELK